MLDTLISCLHSQPTKFHSICIAAFITSAKMVLVFSPSRLTHTEGMLGGFRGRVRPWQVLCLGSGWCSKPLFNVTDPRLSAGVMSIGHWLFLLYCFFWAGWGLHSLPSESGPRAPHHLLLSRVREGKKMGWWAAWERRSERERSKKKCQAFRGKCSVSEGVAEKRNTDDLVKSQLLNI